MAEANRAIDRPPTVVKETLTPQPQIIIITDLDGTFLDHGSPEQSRQQYSAARESGIPVCFCTSRTVSECIQLHQELGTDMQFPFIAENGACLYFPRGYFEPAAYSELAHESDGEWEVIRLGESKERLLKLLQEVRVDLARQNISFSLFSEMAQKAPEWLQQITGHTTLEAAARAGDRRYADLVYLHPEEGQTVTSSKAQVAFRQAVQAKGLTYLLGGRFHGITLNTDKGKAVQTLLGLFRKKFGKEILSVGIGDAHNDVALLDNVDQPYLVQKGDGTFDSSITNPKVQRVAGIGSVGWNQVIVGVMEKYLH